MRQTNNLSQLSVYLFGFCSLFAVHMSHVQEGNDKKEKEEIGKKDDGRNDKRNKNNADTADVFDMIGNGKE